MSNLSKRRNSIACPRCKATMDEVVRIEPLQNEPGLIGYECPSCRYRDQRVLARVAARRFAANLSACDQPRHTARTIQGRARRQACHGRGRAFHPLSGLRRVDRLPRPGVRVRARRAAAPSGAGPTAMTKKNAATSRASSTAGSSTRLRSSASIGKFSTSNASKPSPTQCAS